MTLLDGIRCNMTLIQGASNKLQRENAKYPSVVSYKNSNDAVLLQGRRMCDVHWQRRCPAYRTSSAEVICVREQTYDEGTTSAPALTLLVRLVRRKDAVLGFSFCLFLVCSMTACVHSAC
jgi:hypothetical protein